MLVLNKVAVQYVPSPSLVLLIQLIATVFAVKKLNAWNPAVFEVEPLKYAKARAFFAPVVLFCFCLVTNMQALKYSKIEAVIVFRACTPICVSFMDYFFLSRELPSRRSLVGMLGIVLGAILFFIAEN
jgi:GDP-mannose transporter